MAVALRTQQVGDDQAIFLGPMVLVASKSEPGSWHQVQDGTCDCKGFQYRGTCRHLVVAHTTEEADRTNAVPVTAPETEAEKLARLERTRDHWGDKPGKNAERQYHHYERLARNLAKKMAYQAANTPPCVYCGAPAYQRTPVTFSPLCDSCFERAGWNN